MSRLSEEMKVIPRTAWAIAVVAYLFFVVFAWRVIIPDDDNLFLWPVAGRALFAVGMPLFLMAWVLLVGYVNGDARRRGMRHVMWTLLAIFIPNAIGIILYFIMRDPPIKACSRCGKAVRGGFGYCPHCGAEVAPSCPGCGRAMESGWSHCPGCGRGLRAA